MTLSGDLDRATLDCKVEDDRAVATLRFTGDEVFFEGHFPSGPVLPAVVQVASAVKLAERVTGGALSLAEVTRAKFTNPAGPGHDLTVSVRVEPAGDRLRVKAKITEGDNEIAELSLRVTPKRAAQ